MYVGRKLERGCILVRRATWYSQVPCWGKVVFSPSSRMSSRVSIRNSTRWNEMKRYATIVWNRAHRTAGTHLQGSHIYSLQALYFSTCRYPTAHGRTLCKELQNYASRISSPLEGLVPVHFSFAQPHWPSYAWWLVTSRPYKYINVEPRVNID